MYILYVIIAGLVLYKLYPYFALLRQKVGGRELKFFTFVGIGAVVVILAILGGAVMVIVDHFADR